jgi:CheY-like chemotaxis protein
MAESSNPPPTPTPAAPSVLVVEDEEDLRGAIREVLTMRGCSVDTAATGTEALRHVVGRRYQVVISDIHPPQIDGIELARLLSRRTCSPGIILITAFAGPDTEMKAYAAGARYFLPKPVSLTALARVVEELGMTSPR